MNSMAAYEYRAESHVTDRLERENAQLRAVIAEQRNYPHVNEYIAQQYAAIQRLRGVVDEQKETIEKLRLAYADSVIESGEKAELIETLAEALKSAKKYECGWNLAAEESLQLYEEWNKCPTNHI